MSIATTVTTANHMLAVLDAAAAAIPAFAGAVFDAERARRCVAFFPVYLRHTEGEWAGRPFVLMRWQAEIVARAFGWRRPDGTRVYRRVALWVARKNGKTEFLAGLSLLALIADGEQGGQGFAVARDEKQARLVFAKMGRMIAYNPELAQSFSVYKSGLLYTPLGAGFRPLSGNPDGKHGLSMSVMAVDEMHEIPDDRLYTFVHQSAAARRQPIEFMASTAGLRGVSFGSDFYDHCTAVLAEPGIDPSLLVVIFAAGDDDDWAAAETWAMANPGLGTTVKRSYLDEECAKARRNPRLENDFRRYHLNQWVGQDTRWLQMSVWDRCASVDWRDESHLAGRPAYGGLDLSATRDITALVWVFPPVEDDPVYHVRCRFWLPGETLDERVLRDRVPYDRFAALGALVKTAGNAIDQQVIQRQIMADVEAFDVQHLGYDPWSMKLLAVALYGDGVPVVSVRQGFVTLSSPAKHLETLLLRGEIDHGGHPVLRWMAQNVAVVTDPAGNIKPAKNRSSEKIDGIAALVTALATLPEDSEPAPVSPWEDPSYEPAIL